jgi:UDP-3-O-[3-hydroxymyristoyl] glucosamine N-acyltransferase
MKISVQELCDLVGGTLTGVSSLTITGAAGLEEAGPVEVSFLKDLKSAKNSAYLNSKAGVILAPRELDDRNKTLILVDHPLAAFCVVLRILEKEKRVIDQGIHSTAVIHPTATIGPNVSVGPYCVVEEGARLEENCVLKSHVTIGARSRIGAGTLIYPQVVIREDVTIGAHCILHAGCVVGADGYGFYFFQGRHQKIPQVGAVVIEDDVEIGAGTTIDRATTGQTIIRAGVKIDNLVQIAHNVDIGENSLLVAQVGIAGSSKIGKGVVLAGQVGVGDHIVVGDGTQVGGQSGVNKDTQAGSILFGSPAQPLMEELKQSLLLRKLPELFKDVKNLKTTLEKNNHE